MVTGADGAGRRRTKRGVRDLGGAVAIADDLACRHLAVGRTVAGSIFEIF